MGRHFKGHKQEFKKTTTWTQNLISTKFLYLNLLVSSQKKIKKVFGKILWLSVISIKEHIEIMLRPGCFIGNFTSVFQRGSCHLFIAVVFCSLMIKWFFISFPFAQSQFFSTKQVFPTMLEFYEPDMLARSYSYCSLAKNCKILYVISAKDFSCIYKKVIPIIKLVKVIFPK